VALMVLRPLRPSCGLNDTGTSGWERMHQVLSDALTGSVAGQHNGLRSLVGMESTDFANCQECGRKLKTTLFCVLCSLPLCSPDCLRTHRARHANGDDAPREANGSPPSPQ
jgi:hypothetical protein